MSDRSPSTTLYADLLADIKLRVRHAQTRAWRSVKAELLPAVPWGHHGAQRMSRPSGQTGW